MHRRYLPVATDGMSRSGQLYPLARRRKTVDKTLLGEINTSMQRSIILWLLLPIFSHAQTDTAKWLRAFPITDYMVELNDSAKVVQLQMPDGLTIRQNQLGVLYGVYNKSKADAVEKGYGKCHLIKSDYYYFSIVGNKSGLPLQKGDILYVRMDPTSIYYGRLPKLAGHFIRLLNVYDEPFYDRYLIFSNWTEADERNCLDSMLKDIQFTGGYFLNNEPGMNVPIKSGDYEGRKVLNVMTECTVADVEDFIEYVLARPRNYAGKEWKVSEIFATWLSEGAPKVIR